MYYSSQTMQQNVTCHRKCNWDFICSHGLIMPTVNDSDFGPDGVGKLHVSIQNAKCTKSKCTVLKGKYEYLFFSPFVYVNSFIIWIPLFFEFYYSINSANCYYWIFIFSLIL